MEAEAVARAASESESRAAEEVERGVGGGTRLRTGCTGSRHAKQRIE